MIIDARYMFRDGKELVTIYQKIEGQSKTSCIKKAKDYAKTMGYRYHGFEQVISAIHPKEGESHV